MRALAKHATTRKHVNVLQHMQGYFKKVLPDPQRRELEQGLWRDLESECGRSILYTTGGLDSGEEIERILRSVPAGASLHWNPSATGKKKYLQYRPNGRAPAQNGNFAYCPPDRNARHGWVIVLNGIGRPCFGKRGGDGIPRNGSGKALEC